MVHACCPDCTEMDRLEAEQLQKRRGVEMGSDEWFRALEQWNWDADALLRKIRQFRKDLAAIDAEYADLWDSAARAEREALWRARLEEAEAALDTGCGCRGSRVLVEEWNRDLETWRMVPVCAECGARGR